MSPTSCRCSTPRRAIGLARSYRLLAVLTPLPDSLDWPSPAGGGGCPRRPRLPWGRPHSTLRRCAGSRPGSGWDRVGPARSRPRAPPTPHAGGRDAPCCATSAARSAPSSGRSVGPPRSCPASPARPAQPHHAVSLVVPLACGPRPDGGKLPRAGAGRPAVGSRRPDGSIVQDLRPRPLGRLGSSRLPAVHLPPINPVICRGSYLLQSGEARLGEGFPLRCFQRFARPHVATQRCRLPDNWPTSGASTPVLSY